MNPVIYVVTQRRYREAYKYLLCGSSFRQGTVGAGGDGALNMREKFNRRPSNFGTSVSENDD